MGNFDRHMIANNSMIAPPAPSSFVEVLPPETVIAAQHLKKLRKRPDAKRLLKIAEAWRPWRSAAAPLLLHYRRNMPDWSKKE